MKKIRSTKRVFPDNSKDNSVLIINNEKKKFGIFNNGFKSKTHKLLTTNSLNEKSIPCNSTKSVNLNSSPIICNRKTESIPFSLHNNSKNQLADLEYGPSINPSKPDLKGRISITEEEELVLGIKNSFSERIIPIETLTEISLLKLLHNQSESDFDKNDFLEEDWSFSDHSQLSSLSE